VAAPALKANLPGVSEGRVGYDWPETKEGLAATAR
jgi:hypothetical protein